MSATAIEYPTIRWARELPDHPAIISENGRLSYGQLEQRIARCAEWLLARDVVARDRVIVSGANSTDWIVVIHALARIGAVHVPISSRILPSQADTFQRTYTPRITIVDQTVAHLWSNPIQIEESVGVEESQFRDQFRNEIGLDSLHSIVQTSGSEGEPKGVCLTFKNHLSSALGSALNLGVNPHDRWLLNLPMDRIGGLAIAIRAAMYGIAVVLHDRFDAEGAWKSIDEDAVTQLSCVATTLRRLLDACPERRCPDHVRTVMVGGGPVSESLMNEARRRGFPILPTYGLTETSSQIATLSPAAPDSKRYTAGVALPLADIDIRDDNGSTVTSGTAGRIHVRGPMVSSGYWVAVGRVEMSLDSDGWFATNDVGSIDEDGYLTVHGRRDNVITSGGEKMQAEEIENALMTHEAIARAIVVAAHDPDWQQRPVAIVELKEGRSGYAEQFRQYLVSLLPKHKIPDRFEVVDSLPILPSGKPDRLALKDRYGT